MALHTLSTSAHGLPRDRCIRETGACTLKKMTFATPKELITPDTHLLQRTTPCRSEWLPPRVRNSAAPISREEQVVHDHLVGGERYHEDNNNLRQFVTAVPN